MVHLARYIDKIFKQSIYIAFHIGIYDRMIDGIKNDLKKIYSRISIITDRSISGC